MAAIVTNARVRVVWTALRALLVLTAVCGLLYPLAVTGVAQAVFPAKANGSVAEAHGRPVGSRLIGQYWGTPHTVSVHGEKTTVIDPDPRWFQPRPSAGNDDPAATGASNLAATSPDLTKTVRERRAEVARFNGADPADVPADAVTASGSGVDPDISPAYARLQADRVARARHLDPAAVRALVRSHTRGRELGILGAPRVDVLELNIALDGLAHRTARAPGSGE